MNPILVCLSAMLCLGEVSAEVIHEFVADRTGTIDVSGNFTAQLNSLQTGDTLQVPCGDYLVSHQIAVNLFNKAVSIQGDGKGVTRIICDNQQGIFRFNNTTSESQLSISDLTLAAKRANSGIAVHFINPALSSNLSLCSLRMKGIDYQKLSSDCWFRRGVHASNLQQPKFEDVWFEGFTVGYTGTNQTYSGSEAGFRIDNVQNPSFVDCYVRQSQFGVQLTGVVGVCTIKRLVSVANFNGIQLTAPPQAGAHSEALVSDSFTGGYLTGTDAKNIKKVTMKNVTSTGANWYTEDKKYIRPPHPYPSDYDEANQFSWPPYSDIIISRCPSVLIDGCNFFSWYVTYGRVCVSLSGTTTNDVNIKHCIFNASPNRGKYSEPPVHTESVHPAISVKNDLQQTWNGATNTTSGPVKLEDNIYHEYGTW